MAALITKEEIKKIVCSVVAKVVGISEESLTNEYKVDRVYHSLIVLNLSQEFAEEPLFDIQEEMTIGTIVETVIKWAELK